MPGPDSHRSRSPTTSAANSPPGHAGQSVPAARPPSQHRPRRRRRRDQHRHRPRPRRHPPTVGKWRSRFLSQRLDGLADEPRPGPPRTLTDARVEEVVTRTLETKPDHATHWSTRSLANTLGLSQTAVARIWRAFGLKPHLHETFKLSTDPYFVEKVRDIVGVVPESAGPGDRPLRGREVPSSGPGPDPTDPADDVGTGRGGRIATTSGMGRRPCSRL